jgi:putative transposase
VAHNDDIRIRQSARKKVSSLKTHPAAILDAWSRRVVGYAISRSIDARVAVGSIVEHLFFRRAGLAQAIVDTFALR